MSSDEGVYGEGTVETPDGPFPGINLPSKEEKLEAQAHYRAGYKIATDSISREILRILDDERISVAQSIREVRQFLEEIS